METVEEKMLAMALPDLAKAPWLTRMEDVPSASNMSLKRALLTPDGGGIILKMMVLNELLNREKV